MLFSTQATSLFQIFYKSMDAWSKYIFVLARKPDNMKKNKKNT